MKSLKSRKVTLIFCLILCSLSIQQLYASEYLQIKVKKGQSIFSILRQYKLANVQCNVKAFYEINSLNTSSKIYYDKSYKIPIKVYKYNGKSIRSTISINDYDKALRIQEYNKALESTGIKKKKLYTENELWVPYHELRCDGVIVGSEEKESKDESYVFNKLFGKKHSSIKIIDRSLKNKVFYIVSGHGGPDPGAMCEGCPKDMCEDEYAYDVSLRLARNLMQHGAIVHMIIEDANDGIRDEKYLKCDKDEKCNGEKIPLNQLKRLNQRAININKLYRQYKAKGITDQRAIVIHVDSRGKNKQQDVFFYHLEGSKNGKRIAKNLHKTFDTKYKQYQKNRGYKGYIETRGLYMLRMTNPPAVYVELANIRNKHNHKRLIYDYNRQALANWLFEGLIK